MTNEEARRKHEKLPTKLRSIERNVRRGRPITSIDLRGKRRRHCHATSRAGEIKIQRGCESGCCPVTGLFFPEDLAFHHCYGKKSGVSQIQSWPAKLAEINKCLVLCHICHGRYHQGRIDLTAAIKKRWPDVEIENVVAGAASHGQRTFWDEGG